MKSRKRIILSPMSGQTAALEEAPDEVFSRRTLGDGVAIRPTDGLLASPVDGVVTSVAPTRHAYGFTSEDGLELLVHVGVDTVQLQGEGFCALVQEGERVRAGQPVAQVDLALLEARGLETITPVILVGGGEGVTLQIARGSVKAGQDPLLTLVPPRSHRPAVSFDFLQKLGKSLMTVIAVMPAAGLVLSLGKLLQMADAALPAAIGSVMETIGWAVIGNLHLLFAAAIGGSWAKDWAGGAFAGVLAFVLINAITGALFGVTDAMLAAPDATVRSLLGQEMAVSSYFTLILGRPALNMGVFAGVIAGFTGGEVYNRFYSFRRMPQALAFFNGKRFVPLMVIVASAALSLALALLWPLVQAGINAFGLWIASSADSSPVLAPFIYGTLERLLLPFGLHHMLTIPMNYTSFGGEYLIRTGAAAGTVVYGQDPLWLAWVTDLINLKAGGSPAEAAALMAGITPGRFKVGQMIGSTGLLPGVALAMYAAIPRRRRERYRSMFLSGALAVLLTGVTEPIEFMFMFSAPALYAVYALLQGCAFALAGVIPLRLHAFGLIETLTRVPMSLRAGLAGDLLRFALACGAFLLVGFALSRLLILRLKLATPGRMEEPESAASPAAPANDRTGRIIALLGGRENITLVDACMTRLRVTVKDASLVAPESDWKQTGALGLLIRDSGVQVVYGPEADVIKSDVNDAL